MPGLKKLCQESENSSKPQFIHGHMFGGIGTAIGNHLNSFCIPMVRTIQDGLKETASWTGRSLSRSLSHVIQMIRNGHVITQTFSENVYFALDRYFLTVPLLIDGFSYHFWNSKVPKPNKYKKKSDPDPLTFIREEDRLSVLSTVEAIERFVLCSEISMGIIQMIALNPAFVEMIDNIRLNGTITFGHPAKARCPRQWSLII